MCWVTEPGVGGGTSKKSVFLKYLLTEQHKNLRKNQAKSFDFPADLQKKIIQKAQRSTILEGGAILVPPPHLVVKFKMAHTVNYTQYQKGLVNHKSY